MVNKSASYGHNFTITSALVHATTGFSPFYMTYGVSPILPGDPLRPFMDPLTEEDPELIAEDALTHLRYLRENRFLAEDRLKVQAEKDKEKWDAALKNQTTQVFQVGEYVMLRHEIKEVWNSTGWARTE
ncbi:hypothetical protein MFLAVUS_011392 [Mucor flavus]|uniref:Uncharacterized protein n=1 Tax=Mucor flavus TaxID=439312 RepID=A0ABP9ZFE8_9FUNG